MLTALNQTQSTYPSWPVFAADEMAAVQRVLQSGKVNYWTGDENKGFEKEFADYHGVDHAISMMNGTVALEAAFCALEIKPGDEIVTTSRTFIASASSFIRYGAKPIFADVDLESQNITLETVQKVLTAKTKAILAVHLAGWPCDMPALKQLAKQHDLYLIEDCAQAHGAMISGKPVGSFGDIAAFSFCQDKIMTTGGEGGMVLTSNTALYKKMWALKDHGKSYDAVYNQIHPPGFRWLHDSFGTNWRMTEMQAAIGRLQLKKLTGWTQRRQQHAAIFQAALTGLPLIRLTTPPAHLTHAYYKYYAFIRPEKLKAGWSRDRLIEAILDQGIPCFSGSCSEIYAEKAFVKANLGPKQPLPNAKQLGETSLMFLVHPTLTESQVKDVAMKARDVIWNASEH